MKIDILFLNNEMNGHDQYFDNDLFQEYCETHSFEGKKNQILSVPPSYSKSENLTLIVGLGENKEDINFYDLGTLIGSKINSDAEIKFLNAVEDTNLIIDGILYIQYKFNNYKSKDDSSINSITFQDLDSSENEIKKHSVFWVRDLINTPALDKSPEEFINKVRELVDSSGIEAVSYTHLRAHET